MEEQNDEVRTLLQAAQSGDREAMHALGDWYLEQFDEEHYRELLDPGTLPSPLSERDQLILESQSRLTPEERTHLTEQRQIREEALRWLRAAAQQGDTEACVRLGEFLSRSGDEELKAEALVWFERAASLGDVLSMVTLGRLIKQGWGAAPDPVKAAVWYAKAAARFEEASQADDEFAAVAMGELAKLLLLGDGVPRDPKRAVVLYEKAASRGYHWALIDLGTAYEEGSGVEKDLERARATFERAVAAGADIYARHCLKRVSDAIEEAATTREVGSVRVESDLLAAAEGGDPQAMWQISRRLETEGEYQGAARWLERAANAGHAVSAFAMTLEGDSDDDKAHWRRVAAGLGHVTALHMMGEFWLESEQGAADPAYGYAWIELASRERHAEPAVVAARLRAQAKERAADVWETLDPEQRLRAADLITRCDMGPPHKLPDEV